jgi:hypothetical protein
MRTLIRVCSAIAIFAAPSLSAQSQPTPLSRTLSSLSGDAFMAHIRYLSDDALEGRAPGTRGGDLAAKYVAAQFERLGLLPAGDSGSWYHRIPIITHDPTPTLTVTSTPALPLGYKTDYAIWSMRDDTLSTARSSLVFAGYGTTASEYGWADFEGVDGRGKIIVVLVNDPGLRDPAIFKGKDLTYYGRWTYKIEEAARQGAAGILMVHTDESATYGWNTVVGSWTGEQVRLEKPATSLAFAGWITESAARRLLSLDGQNLDSLSAAAARRGFRATPLKVDLDVSIRSRIARLVDRLRTDLDHG